MMKTLDSQKNTRLQTIHYSCKIIQCKLAVKANVKQWSENALQCKQRHCTTHGKPEAKKTGDSSNTCVCLHRSLKLLTDDHSDFVELRDYMLLCKDRIFDKL